MQEHFNEDYLESDKFPKSSFKGHIVDLDKVSFDKDGKYTVSVAGELTIHGQSRTITTSVTFTILKGVALADTQFDIALSDYNVAIPSLVKDKISKTVKIAVRLNYEAQAQP
jgi:polyisoprenoid-binding protein YceI